MLEPDDEVIGEAHDDHITARIPAPPPLGPQVEDVMKVHVREQRRCRCPLRRSLHGLRPGPILDDSRAQPLADETQDPPVRDAMPEELLQPAVIKAGEEVADVRIEYPVHLPPLDPGRERVQRIMRAAPRPEPIGETPEVHLIDGVEYLDDGPLDDLVLQRGDGRFILPLLQSRVGMFWTGAGSRWSGQVADLLA